MPQSERDAASAGSVDQAANVGIGWRHPHYAALLEQQPALDFLEVHSENFFAEGGAALAVLEQGRMHYPISLHGVALSLGSAAGLDPWHLDQLAALVDRIDPVRISDHACFARGLYQGKLVHASDLLPIPFTPEALNVLCQHVDQVQERLGRPFMVENLSAYIAWQAPPEEAAWQETEFLMALARRTGCSLLVDVNNIYVNALNASKAAGLASDEPAQDPEAACRAWLDAIDLQCVGEMHLAGHCHVNDVHGDIVIDDHGSLVCAAVWRLYGHAVRRFGPVPTLIEWDTDIPPLDVLLGEADRARAVVASTHTRGVA
ncbi:MAG: hypothetical protein CFE43_08475 [Burkholderiales bacterium PBB3]|nr:MAG: hypothetical protein CFE43_08475 [Burkholderiales bacterium PBB3]